MNTLQVDFSKVTGKIKPMHAVNNGPVAKNMEAFRDAGFPCCRNHDASFAAQYGGAHAHDVLNIFPNFDADENDPANYDFVLTDKTIRETYQCGSTMLYRLGSKIEHEIKKYQTLPPKDFHKYARICEHIIRHYCYGWADGMELPIVYWEIWNEPDCHYPSDSNPCWGGTQEQFLEFYEVMAKHLKSCFPELKIGGPAFTGGRSAEKRQLMDNFLRYAREHQVPLDFFSWHGYRTSPWEYVEDITWTKDLLIHHGFGDIETILNEWNYVRAWKGPEYDYSMVTIRNEKGAAFCASSMLAAQKSPLDMFMYYDARPATGWNGLFVTHTYALLPPYYAFWQFNKLYRLENEVFSQSDSRELFVGAARNGGKAAAQVVYYSDEDLPEREVTVSLKGLETRSKIVGLLTDREHNNEKVLELTVPAGDTELVLKLQLHSVLLLTAEAV